MRLLDGLPVAIGAWITALVLTAWAGRVPYPYDLEWMEGGMLVHAWRIQHGLPIYVEPDATWIPYIYPPGYPAVVAAVGAITGLGLPLGRAVSVAGTLAACGALLFAGWRQGSAVAGLLGAMVFLACWPDSGAFYDLVRPDALGVGLAGWALVLGLEPGRRERLIAAGLLAAAFVVKHNLAAFGVPMALGIWALRGWREALTFGLTAALPALSVVFALELASAEAFPWPALLAPASAVLIGMAVAGRGSLRSGLLAAGLTGLPALAAASFLLRDVGHFQRTVLGVPGAHPLVVGRLMPGSVEELGTHLGVALAGCCVALIAGTAHLAGRAWPAVVGLAVLGVGIGEVGLQMHDADGVPPATFWAEAAGWGALGGAIGATIGGGIAPLLGGRLDGRWVYGVGVALTAALVAGLMRAHHGGFLNVFIPLHWVVALSVVAALTGSRRVWPHPVVAAVGALVIAVQLGSKADIDPSRYTPDAADRAAGDAFVEALRSCDGPVLSPYAPWLPVQAGHEPSFHLIALWDLNHGGSPYREAVDRVTRAADAHHWACVVEGSGKPLGYGIQRNYQQDRVPRVVASADRPGPQTFMPKTGWRVRPRAILVPKAVQPPPGGPITPR